MSHTRIEQAPKLKDETEFCLQKTDDLTKSQFYLYIDVFWRFVSKSLSHRHILFLFSFLLLYLRNVPKLMQFDWHEILFFHQQPGIIRHGLRCGQ